MKSPKRLPATTLPAASDSTPFFIRRFQGRKHAVSHGPHRHRFFEVIVIEAGAGTQVLEGKTTAVKRGDVFVISPGESHDPDGLDPTVHWIVEAQLKDWLSLFKRAEEELEKKKLGYIECT